MKKLNKKWIVMIIVVALIILGHIVPVSTKAVYPNPCASQYQKKVKFRLINGEADDFRYSTGLEVPLSSNSLVCSSPIRTGTARLYLW
jgi:hypothetical protein